MDVDQLISRAWAAVEGAGVPEPLHEIAFKEAIDFLREDAAPDAPEERDSKRKQTRSRREPKPGDGAKKDARQPTDQATFWERLAHESGIEESVLRDVLQFNDTDVHVTPPTRNLGSNVAEQAKTVISLVAGARGIGLDEQPVSAPAVREELQRKRCYNSGNFAAKHLGPLRGFNAGSNRTEIVLTSKWIDDFAAAVKTAHGDSEED